MSCEIFVGILWIIDDVRAATRICAWEIIVGKLAESAAFVN